MCIDEGMGLCPWGVLGQGGFKTSAQLEQTEKSEGRQSPPREAAAKVSKVLEAVAERKGVPGKVTSVALAYVMGKTPYVFPIVGTRKVEHLKGNIEALELRLDEVDIKEIEAAVPFELGFPMDLLGGGDPSKNWLLNLAGHFDYVGEKGSLSLGGK